MNRDDIIRLAREAGWAVREETLPMIANLIIAGYEAGSAAEREACAKVCEVEYAACWHNSAMAAAKAAERCATAIRLRGGK